jgi:copper chaperone CopZ
VACSLPTAWAEISLGSAANERQVKGAMPVPSFRTAPFAGALVGIVIASSGCAISPREGTDGSVLLKIDGMACANCAKHIERELEAVPGVESASVSFAAKTATVRLDAERPASLEQLNAAVAAWKREHFAADEDPDCLDPERRQEIKRGG